MADVIVDAELPDAEHTHRFGAGLGAVLQTGDVVCLHGGLGAGKTTLARGMVAGFTGLAQEVVSPTFTLMQTYERGDGSLLHHFDLYRVDHPDEVLALAWDEALEDIAVIEWPEQAGAHLPADALHIALSEPAKGGRRAVVSGPQCWRARLSALRVRA